MPDFIKELTRRNVFRVIAAYVIVGWIVLQVASITAPAMHLPDWAVSLVLYGLIVAFPIAIVLTWAFEMTPEGVRKTAAAEGPVAGPSRTDLGLIAIGVLLLIATGFLMPQQKQAPQETTLEVSEPTEPTASDEDASPLSFTLAVLPFENFSDDKQLGWIADGISEDLLTQLASYPRLAIAARNSSYQYKGQSPDIRDVGKALNVRFVLEGSLRLQGDALRVTAQLIDTSTGNHLWAGQFNPALSEIATLHDTVIDAVALEVASTILTSEFDRLAKTPPQDLSAADANHVANKHFVEGDIGKSLLYVDVLKERDFPPSLNAVVGAYVRFMRPFFNDREALRAQSLLDWEEALNTATPGAWKEVTQGYGALNLGEHDLAHYHAKRSYELAPHYVGSLWVFAAVENTLGNYEHGLALAQACVQTVNRLDAFVGICHEVTAESLLALGRYEEAASSARLARHTRNVAFNLVILCAAQVGLGDIQGAKETMKEYLAMTYRDDRRGLELRLESYFGDANLKAFILNAVDVAGINEEAP